MRLFTAIDLPSDVLLRLDRLLSVLRPEALIKWSPLDNLHITTKFIGEWSETRLPELHESLVALAPRATFDVEIKDLGWFPNERSPRVLWAGVQGGEALPQLAQETEKCMDALGVKREDRPFAGHLTLARIKNPVPLQALRQRVQEVQPVTLGQFPVTRFSLYRSYPGSNASIYRKLREYSFESALAAS